MKRFLKGLMFAGVLAFGALTLSGCDRVEPGYVGIKVNKLGDDKGVGEVVGVGRVWTGINTTLYTFPTFKQMKTYEQPFYFSLSDGTNIGHKVGVEYTVDPAKITSIFQTYRKGVDEITETDLRLKIEKSLNRRGNKINTDKFIDGGKADLLDETLADLQKELNPAGINVLSLSWVGAPEYPENVKRSINAKVEATQKTLQRVQEVQQSKAEADKKVEESRGEAESTLLKAEAEAKSINMKGDALRKNPEVINWAKIEKWDGKLPVYQSGSEQNIISIPASK